MSLGIGLTFGLGAIRAPIQISSDTTAPVLSATSWDDTARVASFTKSEGAAVHWAHYSGAQPTYDGSWDGTTLTTGSTGFGPAGPDALDLMQLLNRGSGDRLVYYARDPSGNISDPIVEIITAPDLPDQFSSADFSVSNSGNGSLQLVISNVQVVDPAVLDIEVNIGGGWASLGTSTAGSFAFEVPDGPYTVQLRYVNVLGEGAASPGKSVTVTSGASNAITGPSGFASAQFNDETDTASFTAPFAGTLHAVTWESANAAPTLTASGFTGTTIEIFSSAISEGQNSPALNFSNTSADRLSYGIVSAGGTLSSVIVESITWPQSVALTNLGYVGQNNYGGGAQAFPSFTLSQTENVVAVLGGRGNYDAVTGMDVNGQTLTLISGTEDIDDLGVPAGSAIVFGQLPAGTYDAITPQFSSGALNTLNVQIIGVGEGTVQSAQSRGDRLTSGEQYTMPLNGAVVGDAAISAIGLRNGSGDGVGLFTAIGSTEILDTGTQGTGAGSQSGHLFVSTQLVTAAGDIEIGGEGSGNYIGAGSAILLRAT